MKNLILITMLFAFSANAQTPDRKWAVGIQGGSEQYSGDLGNGFYSFDQAFYGFLGVSIARSISKHFDVEINATLGEIGHIENGTNKFRFSLAQFNVNAKYNFFRYDSVSFRPFVFLGMGYMNFTDKAGGSDRNFENMQLPSFGAGVTYKVSPTIGVVLKETFIYTDYDSIEYETGKENDFFVQHSLGVVFNFGKVKDRSSRSYFIVE